jgi:uncharacterized RDD family membrane protein YckC
MNIDAAAGWTARHRFIGPLGLGLTAGGAILVPFAIASGLREPAVGAIAALMLIAVYAGTSMPGYLIGLAGFGAAEFLLSTGGLVAPLALAVVVTSTPSPPDTDCRSCLVDTLAFGAPFIVAMLAAPLAIGYRRGRRARSNSAVGSGGAAPVSVPPPDPPSGFEFGGFRVRSAALIVDAAVLFAVLVAAGLTQRALPPASPLAFAVGMSWFAVSLAYMPVQWALVGRTFGMRAFGLKVVGVGDGGKIGRTTALVRFVAWIISGFAMGLGFVFIAFDPQKRGVHDMIAGTVVIRQSRGTRLEVGIAAGHDAAVTDESRAGSG